MRSRAERRARLEALLRVASLVLLFWMLWLSLDRSRAARLISYGTSDLTRTLQAWSALGVAPGALHVQLDSTPTARDRDWLAALGAAGSEVSWSGTLPALGIEVESVPTPRGGLTVRTAAADGTRLVLSDELGELDTASARGGGARFSIRSANGTIVVRARGSHARARVPDPVRLHRVLVLGAAGWESKFVVTALEEDGWEIDAEMRVAPGASVTQGSVGEVDTSRYSAVIALDAAVAPRASELTRYVAAGGGLILAGSAASVDGLARVRAGGAGPAESAPPTAAGGAFTVQSLSLFPVTGLKGDAVALERRGGAVAVAARRHGTGRVLQVGYADTWRWRLRGGESSVAEHRAWWSRAVAGVAYAAGTSARAARAGQPAATPDSVADGMDIAPVAALIDALGAPSARPDGTVAPAPGRIRPWLFALLSICLLAEWTSRRQRGSP